jgi:hypothetical protein
VANAISKRLRFEILRRDNYTCRYCGALAANTKLVVDHVIPVALGGMSDPANLAAACEDCNTGKSSVNPDSAVVVNVSEDAKKWTEALKVVADRQRAKSRSVPDSEVQQRIRSCLQWVESLWPNGQQLIEDPDLFEARTYPLPDGWKISVARIVRCGLNEDDLTVAAMTALNRDVQDRWLYFCGTCWSMLRQRQETAATDIHGPSACSDKTSIDRMVDLLDSVLPGGIDHNRGPVWHSGVSGLRWRWVEDANPTGLAVTPHRCAMTDIHRSKLRRRT